MDKRPILALDLGLLAAGAVLAQAYKWVDEDGVVHFSDRPRGGAERDRAPRGKHHETRFASTDAPTAARNGCRKYRAPDESVQLRILIEVAARPEETLWNIEGVR